MKDINTWIDAQVDILRENIIILEENKLNIDKSIVQLWCMKKHVDYMVNFLERKRNLE